MKDEEFMAGDGARLTQYTTQALCTELHPTAQHSTVQRDTFTGSTFLPWQSADCLPASFTWHRPYGSGILAVN